MIVELLCVAAVFAGGCATVRVMGLRGWSLPAFGLLVGVALELAIGTVQAVSGLPTWPLLTVLLTAVPPLAWWAVRLWRGYDVGVSPRAALLTAAGLTGTVSVLWVANLTKHHTDSFTYLMVGRMLADGTFRGEVSTQLLTKRTLGVPLLHAPANLGGELALRSITALVTASTLAALVWFLREGTRSRSTGTAAARIAVFSALAVLLLLSNNRFVFSFFYLNGHLLFAAMILLIAGSGWLLARGGHDRLRPVLCALQLLAIPALVVTRPEAAISAVLALLPTWLSPAIPRGQRAATMTVLGASTIGWHAFQVWVHVQREAPVPTSAWGAIAIGVATLAAIGLLRFEVFLRRPYRVLFVVEAGLWLALLAAAVRDPQTLTASVRATILNQAVGYGLWGRSVIVLAIIGVGVLIFFRAPALAHLRFPVTTFVPFGFLLAFLREEGPYRVGYGDSLTRMIMQYVPLAVLFIVAVLVTAQPAGEDEAEPVEAMADQPAGGTSEESRSASALV
jgi:hypothetical protein